MTDVDPLLREALARLVRALESMVRGYRLKQLSSVHERVGVDGTKGPHVIRQPTIIACAPPELTRRHPRVIPDVQRIGRGMRPRKDPGRHLAIRRRRVEHRHLIERRRKAQTRTGSEEEDVVLMPVRISDERTERIKPSKAAGIFISETPGVPQRHGRASP